MAIPPYTEIPDDRLAPDAPVRSVDAIALRDNPLAIAQADEADATPQIYTDGIADQAVTNAKIDDGTIELIKLSTWYLTAGAVGTYALLGSTNTVAVAVGSTKAGSNLRYMGMLATASFTNPTPAAAGNYSGNGGTPAGTWQCMGRDGSSGAAYGATLWLRIA